MQYIKTDSPTTDPILQKENPDCQSGFVKFIRRRGGKAKAK